MFSWLFQKHTGSRHAALGEIQATELSVWWFNLHDVLHVSWKSKFFFICDYFGRKSATKTFLGVAFLAGINIKLWNYKGEHEQTAATESSVCYSIKLSPSCHVQLLALMYLSLALETSMNQIACLHH